MSEKLKYGPIDGKADEVLLGLNGGKGGGLAASTVLPAKSGRLVVYDVSNAAFEAVASDASAITGYVDQIITAAIATTTKNTAKVPIISVVGRTFEMPFARAGAAATLTQAILDAIIGLNIDIYVDGDGIQYADDANSGSIGTQHVLTVMGGNVAEGTLFVKVNDADITSKA